VERFKTFGGDLDAQIIELESAALADAQQVILAACTVLPGHQA
jgi:hypothetical protein